MGGREGRKEGGRERGRVGREGGLNNSKVLWCRLSWGGGEEAIQFIKACGCQTGCQGDYNISSQNWWVCSD